MSAPVITIPPSYDASVQGQTNPPLENHATNEIIQNVYNQIQNIDTAATISSLATDVITVQEDFNAISRTVGELDAKNFKQGNAAGTSCGNFRRGTPIPQFQQEWDAISTDFNELLWRSREVATAGALRAQEYREVMIPMINDEDVSLADKKEELRHFISDIDLTTRSAKEMSEKFLAIPNRIRNFERRVSSALSSIDIASDDTFKKKLGRLNEEIQTLTDTMEKLRDWSDTAWKAMSLGLGVGGGSGLLRALGVFLGPINLGFILAGAGVGVVGGVTGLVLDSKVPGVMTSLQRKRAELNQLQANKDFIGIQGPIKLALANTAVMCGRLNAIPQFWAELRTDAQRIRDTLEGAKDSRTVTGFHTRLNNMQVTMLYQTLEDMLLGYANHVVNPPLAA